MYLNRNSLNFEIQFKNRHWATIIGLSGEQPEISFDHGFLLAVTYFSLKSNRLQRKRKPIYFDGR